MMSELRDQLHGLLRLQSSAPPGRLPDHATLLRPEGDGPHPAVLYCHAHGGDYALGRREITEGAPWLAGPPAPDLVAAGFAVLCLDMPSSGDRQSEGSESALVKAGLWHGRPLFAQIVGTQLTAFGWLAARREIDADRIAPRPQFIGLGEDDALTPPLARNTVLARVRAAYCTATALETFTAAGSGHLETPEMRAHVLDFLSWRLAQNNTLTRETC